MDKNEFIAYLVFGEGKIINTDVFTIDDEQKLIKHFNDKEYNQYALIIINKTLKNKTNEDYTLEMTATIADVIPEILKQLPNDDAITCAKSIYKILVRIVDTEFYNKNF